MGLFAPENAIESEHLLQILSLVYPKPANFVLQSRTFQAKPFGGSALAG